MDQYILDDTKYDAIIIGSSLSQTLLAAGLSRAGKKVLLIDPANNYGSHQATLNFKDLRSYFGFSSISNNTSIYHEDEENVIQIPQPGADASDHEWETYWVQIMDQSNSISRSHSAKSDQNDSPLTQNDETPSTETGVDVEVDVEVDENVTKIQEQHTNDSDSHPCPPVHRKADLVDMENLSFVPFYASNATQSEPFFASGKTGFSNINEKFSGNDATSVQQELEKKSSQFSIDLSPQLLLSSSPLINVLIRTDTTMYVEFKAIEHVLMLISDHLRKESASSSAFAGFLSIAKSHILPSTSSTRSILSESQASGPSNADRNANITSTTLSSLYDVDTSSCWSVPSSRGDIFQDALLSLEAKNCLMTCLHILLHDSTNPQTQQHHLDTYTSFSQLPIQDLFDHLKVPALLRLVLLYCTILAPLAPSSAQTNANADANVSVSDSLMYPHALSGFELEHLTTESASHRLKAYLTSVGRLTKTAYIYPSYGFSDILQAFVHLSCVYGSICVLRMRPSCFVYQGDAFKGIVTGSGQFIQADMIFTDVPHWNSNCFTIADDFETAAGKTGATPFLHSAREVSIARTVVISKKLASEQPQVHTKNPTENVCDESVSTDSQPSQSVESEAPSSVTPLKLSKPIPGSSLMFIPPSQSKEKAKSHLHEAPIRVLTLDKMTESCPNGYSITHFSVPISSCPITMTGTKLRPEIGSVTDGVLSNVVSTFFNQHKSDEEVLYSISFDHSIKTSSQGVHGLIPTSTSTSTTVSPGVFVMMDGALHDVCLDTSLSIAEKAFAQAFAIFAAKTKEKVPVFLATRKADGSHVEQDQDQDQEQTPSIDGEDMTKEMNGNDNNNKEEDAQISSDTNDQTMKKDKKDAHQTNKELDKVSNALSALDDLDDLLDLLDDDM